ncbi:MAG TPA: FAD:protein FMN transferase [Candidatus Sulfotelmatobacter sp.]|nr:FAD:protein FMN transferase [Candidatus Sulfotelmatobacter sp.]
MRCAKRVAIAMIPVFFSLWGSGQKSDTPLLVHGKKYVMGTVFEIVAYDKSSEHASMAIEKAFQEIVRVDDLLSNYKAESALSKLNRSAHFHAQEVPPDVYRVIETSVEFSRLSKGKFDVSVAPLVNLWKAALSGEAAPSAAQEEKARGCVGYEKIELTPPDRITFHSDCMQLDLGAIGKGYAVDRAAATLQSCGIHDALINAGGSTMVAMGSPPGQTAWLVHLRDPSGKVDPQVMLKDESVSTSEQTPASLLDDHAGGHIIDPDSGRPLKTQFAVSVIANTGTLSDALSTTLLLLGPEEGKGLLNRIPGVSAIWVSPQAQTETVTRGPRILLGARS